MMKPFNQKEKVWVFSGGSVEKNLPDNAGEGFNPWYRRIWHAVEWLSLCTTTTELAFAATAEVYAPGARALQQEKPRNEKPAHQN